jgi:hypothetical protein
VYIDEKERVVGEIFLFEFRKHRRCQGSRRKQADVKQMIRCGIDSGVQPVSLVVELDRGFVDRNVIRVWTVTRL